MDRQVDEMERRRQQWLERKEEMRRQKRRQERIRRIAPIGLGAAVFIIIVSIVIGRIKKKENPDAEMGLILNAGQEACMAIEINRQSEGVPVLGETAPGNDTEEPYPNHRYSMAENVLELQEEITSSHAIFLDVETKTVLAAKEEAERIVPASMTKVLTLLVAVEHIENLDDTFTITGEITDYCFLNGCSNAGFEKGETVTIRDLLYGTVLPSGADAALGLAFYVAGSQEAFVELMNEKLEELGVSQTAHFTNCVGIYDENHYCTVSDMAVMMEAAVCNEICWEVLSARTFLTSETKQHPEGMLLSNWFMRRIEDKDTGGMAVCGKTGYVEQSGNCAVSCGVGEDGKKYICVTVNASNKWSCINDHADLYKRFSTMP